MSEKRILTIQDISCVGRCSMTVALPILSACGHETSILPTAVLSTHTGGFSKPVVHHLDRSVDAFCRHWLNEGIRFDIIYTGYLGNVGAVKATMDLADTLLTADGELIVDPAMADHGKLYSGLDKNYEMAMFSLCEKADILIPNITEAAILSGIEWHPSLDEEYVDRLVNGIDCKRIVLTGVGYEEGETGVEVFDSGTRRRYSHSKIGMNYHGTGDIFASCFTGMRAAGIGIYESARISADFTALCIRNTDQKHDKRYGVCFETALPYLFRQMDQKKVAD